MEICLVSGAIDTNDNLDGWVVTSQRATAEGAEDLLLIRGDQIKINGDVYRNNEFIGNIA